MAKFNQKNQSTQKTVNIAGGEAYKESPKLELVSLLLTSFLKDKHYETSGEQLKRLRVLVASIPDKKFVGKAAIFARNEYGMRSITHALVGELVGTVKGEQWTKTMVAKAIKRPDDIMEIVAYYFAKYGRLYDNGKKRGLAAPLRRGIAAALARYDEYQLSKYKGGTREFKMVDIVNLVRMTPTIAINKLIKGELAPANTWETKLTQAGQKGETEDEVVELKNQAWKNLILEKKIGYFALLRNLRNILQQAPEVIDRACELLVDENMIKKSLVLPYRFLTAIDEINKLSGKDSRKVLKALNEALDISTKNVPVFDGNTLVVLDKSGSMSGEPLHIGSLFAAILAKSNNADLMLFADSAHMKNINPADSTLTIATEIRNDSFSGGTDFKPIFRELKEKYDRIIILSDMQGWVGYDSPVKEFANYKSRTGADSFIYSFDLAGHGTLQFPERNVCALAGFSEKIFDLMKNIEQDKNVLIKKIEAIEL